MDDLITWLKGQLDDHERRILDGWDSDGKARIATMWTGGEPGYTTVASDHGDAHWVANGFHIGDARHVQILWDPKRELADIDAKRRIIDMHDGRHWCSPGPEDTDWRVFEAGEEVTRVYPCLHLRVLALPFADRDGYRTEWRPVTDGR